MAVWKSEAAIRLKGFKCTVICYYDQNDKFYIMCMHTHYTHKLDVD